MTAVIIVAMDGLQPLQVIPDLMPNLSSFAAEGVRFDNHHPVYPSVTRTNVASLLTGRYPGAHGLAANRMLVRDLDPHRVIEASKEGLIELGKRTGRVLLVPNLADILGQHGMEYVAISTGTTGNGFLQNPNADRSGGATIHPEFSKPHDLYAKIVRRFGPWAEMDRPNSGRITQAFRILREYVLDDHRPSVAMLWSSDPDGTQHLKGVGSEASKKALAHVDRRFGQLLESLAQTGEDRETDVIVVSDHGYSTITQSVEVTAGCEGVDHGDHMDDVLVAGNGGSMLFYIGSRNPETGDRLAVYLMAQPWCGALIASDQMGQIEGTIPASTVGVEGPRAPDLTMSFASNSCLNRAGFPGHAYNGGGEPGLGMHGSMSRHEMRSVLIARGPSFKAGITTVIPSGNVDLTPTLLHILGIQTGVHFDGRVLKEALASCPDLDSGAFKTDTFEAERPIQDGIYRQQVMVSTVGSTNYVIEGNCRSAR